MRTLLTVALTVTIVAVLSLPGKTFAAGSDTLVVYANGPSLDEIINSDTTSAGLQVHSVYKLVSLDTTYLYLGAVSVKSNITVVGVVGPEGRSPCIQPGLLLDGSLPDILFNLNGAGTVGKFKNLYIEDLATNNSFTGTRDILISADRIKLYVDNVIFDENHYEAIAFSGKMDDIFVTNCEFRNGVDPTNWFGESAVAVDYPSNSPADSIVIKDCTFLCINSRAVTTGNNGVVNYFDFSHNTYVYDVTEDLRMFSVVNGKINDNIFYGMYAGAEPVSEYPWWFEAFSPATNSLIDFDTLTVAMDSSFDPADAGKQDWRMLAEAKRNIEVENNLYYFPKKITDFWTAWDDTARGGDSLYTPAWMNKRTTHMFTDKTGWPNLVASGNLDVDPGFGTSVQDVLNNSGGTPGVVGLLQYVTEIRTGHAGTDVWGYQPQVVSGANWIPSWPLPEQTSGALAYSTPLTAPDGEPYGDPYWFTLASTPGNFSVVSKGRPYTLSVQPSSGYSDPNGTKLTDGNFALSANYLDSAWVGFPYPDTLVNVTIDLGQSMPVQQFMGDFLLDPTPQIMLPQKVDVSVSLDGTNFTKVGILQDNSTVDTASVHKEYCTLSSPVNARYVRFTMSGISGGGWMFADEFEVLNSSTTTAIRTQLSSLPTKFSLSQNYPNPFNPTTLIRVTLARSGMMSLKVYNVLGQLVKVVDQGYKAPGVYTYDISMNNFASGVYFYILRQGSNSIAKKMLLLK